MTKWYLLHCAIKPPWPSFYETQVSDSCLVKISNSKDPLENFKQMQDAAKQEFGKKFITILAFSELK